MNKYTFKYFRKNYKLNAYIVRDGGYWIITIEDFSQEEERSPFEIPYQWETHFTKYREAKEACIEEMKNYKDL